MSDCEVYVEPQNKTHQGSNCIPMLCLCRALQLPPEAWLRISLANGSLTRVVCRPSGTVALKTLGSSDHMPPNMVTFH